MKYNPGIVLTLTLFILSAIVVNSLIILPHYSYVSSSGSGWYEAVNIFSNAFLCWRKNELLASLAHMLPDLSQVFGKELLLFSLIYLLGLTLWASGKAEQRSPRALAVLVSCVTLSYLYLYSYDSVAMQSVAFLPLLLLSMKKLFASEEWDFKLVITLIAVFYFFLTTANQLSSVLLIYSLIYMQTLPSLPQAGVRNRVVTILMLACGLLYSLLAPAAESPQYPHFARLVPEDGIPGNLMPLIGSFPPVPYINRPAVKELYFIPSLMIFLASLACGIFSKRTKVSWLLLAFSACCVLDCAAPESVSLIAPVYTISRLIPGLFHFVLLPVTLGFTLILLAKHAQTTIPSLTAALCLVFIFAAHGISRQINLATLTQLMPAERFNSEIRSSTRPISEVNQIRKVLASPSYYLISQRGLEYALPSNTTGLKRTHLRPEDLLAVESSAGNGVDLHGSMLDRNEKTRWSVPGVQQSSDQAIRIMLAGKREIKGLNISCGPYVTDFPRGLEISYSAECSLVNGEIRSQLERIFYSPEWMGPIEYTSNGYPYFGNQSDVTVTFPNAIDVKCLEIKQIGRDLHYDWSVTQLDLLVPEK